MDYKIRAPRQKNPNRKRKIWTGTLIGLVITGAIVFFWVLPGNNGVITASGNVQPVGLVSDKTFNGKNITFQYEGGYLVKSMQITQSGTELAMLRADTIYEKLISVRVEQTGGDKLSMTDSSYNLRLSQPKLYRGQQINVAGGPATEWIKDDGTEISVYILHGDKYAVLAFSISDSNDTSGLPDEVSALLQTFQWR